MILLLMQIKQNKDKLILIMNAFIVFKLQNQDNKN